MDHMMSFWRLNYWARGICWLGLIGQRSLLKNGYILPFLNKNCGSLYCAHSLTTLPISASYNTSVKMENPPVHLIVAATKDMGIGFKGSLPWKLKSEMAYFVKMTTKTQDPLKKNAVIVGRKTWESFPAKFRPLKNRINIVLSTQKLDLGPKRDDVIQCYSFQEAINTINRGPLCKEIETAWVIGGSVVYKSALEGNFCDRIYSTEILNDYECDTFMPKWSSDFVECIDPVVPDGMQEENGVKFKYSVLEKVKSKIL